MVAMCAEEAMPSVKGTTNRAWGAEVPPYSFQGGRMEGKGGGQVCSVFCPKSKAYIDKLPVVGPPSRDHRLERGRGLGLCVGQLAGVSDGSRQGCTCA